MFKNYTIAEIFISEVENLSPRQVQIVISMLEKIQADILYEINGFSKGEAEKYGKEYQGDLSDKIIHTVISSIKEINNV